MRNISVSLNNGSFVHSLAQARVATETTKSVDGMLWYVPHSLLGLYQDSLKQQEVTAVGQSVGYVTDWSREFNLSYYELPSDRPLLGSMLIDGLNCPYLNFNNKHLFTEQNLYVDGFLNDIALCYSGTIENNSAVVLGNVDSISYNRFYIGSSATGTIQVGASNVEYDTGIAWGTTPKVVSVLKNSSTLVIRVDAQEVQRISLPLTVRPNITYSSQSFRQTLSNPANAKLFMQFMAFNPTTIDQLSEIENLGMMLTAKL